MDAQQSFGVLAVSAGFQAETGRIGGVVNRQVRLAEELVLVDVDYRNFSGGDEEQVLAFHPVHVLFQFRQLAGIVHTATVD